MSSKKAAVSLSEIYKRVPSKQLKKFDDLKKKYISYTRKLNKYPNKLPNINWVEYKARVRAESKPLLEEFEKKYEALNKMFDERDKLDHSRYYKELEAEKKLVMEEIAKFKKESEVRIQKLEKEIVKYQSLKPYKEMTMEEFCILMPEKAEFVPYYGHNDLFWPFDQEPQTPGPPEIISEDDLGKEPEPTKKQIDKQIKKSAKLASATKADPEPKTEKSAQPKVEATKKVKPEEKHGEAKSKENIKGGKGQDTKNDSTKNDKKKDH